MQYSLYIAQQFSLMARYNVTDAAGRTVYSVESRFAFLREQVIYDAMGRQIAEIKKEFTLGPSRFAIYEYGRQVGTIQREFSFLVPRLRMEYLGWKVEGSVFGWNYDVFNAQGLCIASIRPEFLHFTDHYVIRYENPQDALSLLCLALVIDCLRDANRANS